MSLFMVVKVMFVSSNPVNTCCACHVIGRRRLDPGVLADETIRQKLTEFMDRNTGKVSTVFGKLKQMEGDSLSREDSQS